MPGRHRRRHRRRQAGAHAGCPTAAAGVPGRRRRRGGHALRRRHAWQRRGKQQQGAAQGSEEGGQGPFVHAGARRARAAARCARVWGCTSARRGRHERGQLLTRACRAAASPLPTCPAAAALPPACCACRLPAPHSGIGLPLQRRRAPGGQPAAAHLSPAAALQPAAGVCCGSPAPTALPLLLLPLLLALLLPGGFGRAAAAAPVPSCAALPLTPPLSLPSPPAEPRHQRSDRCSECSHPGVRRRQHPF